MFEKLKTGPAKFLAGAIVTAIIVVAIGHPVIEALHKVLDAVDSLIPGGK